MAGQRKTSRELLDEAIAAQEAGTYVDPVQAAKTFLSKPSVAQGANQDAALRNSAPQAGREAAERLSPMGVAKTYGKVAKDTAVGAGMMVPGPIGMAAGGVASLEGLSDAVEDPSLGNMAMVGLGLLPFAKPLKGLVNGAREARVIKGIRATEGAGDMGAAFSHEQPYRAGSGVSSEGVSRSQPVRGGHAVGHDLDYEATPASFRGMHGNIGDVNAEGGTVPINWRYPETPRMSPEQALGYKNEFVPWKGAKDIVAKVQSMLPESVQGLLSSHGGVRPADDFVHAADTSGAQFGFEHLPEISEGELSRLQALFKRLGR